jgi:hypothetical protein
MEVDGPERPKWQESSHINSISDAENIEKTIRSDQTDQPGIPQWPDLRQTYDRIAGGHGEKSPINDSFEDSESSSPLAKLAQRVKTIYSAWVGVHQSRKHHGKLTQARHM